MDTVARTPLTTAEILRILAATPPERIDCSILRYAAASRAPRSRGIDRASSSE